MPSLQIVKARVEAADAQQGTGGRMIKKVNTATQVMMKKRVNPNQPWQVVLVGDKSYSMEDEYRRGSVQDAIERTLGFAVIVDDDGKVPAVFYGGRINDYVVSLDDFHDFVQRNRIRCDGSTPLTEALQRVAEITGNGDVFRTRHPEVKKMDTPVFAVVVTDGRPDNKGTAVDAVQRLSYRGIFLKFLFVGNDRAGWKFLEELDDDIPVGRPFERGGRLIDNVDAKKLGDLHRVSDADFYEAMYDESNTWLAAARENGLI